jgi:hypothetical protein
MGFVTLGVIVLVLVGIGLWDRAARRKGHTLRSAGAMRRSERDVQRNVRAANTTFANPIDRDWDKPDDRRP